MRIFGAVRGDCVQNLLLDVSESVVETTMDLAI